MSPNRVIDMSVSDTPVHVNLKFIRFPTYCFPAAELVSLGADVGLALGLTLSL